MNLDELQKECARVLNEFLKNNDGWSRDWEHPNAITHSSSYFGMCVVLGASGLESALVYRSWFEFGNILILVTEDSPQKAFHSLRQKMDLHIKDIQAAMNRLPEIK